MKGARRKGMKDEKGVVKMMTDSFRIQFIFLCLLLHSEVYTERYFYASAALQYCIVFLMAENNAFVWEQ